MKGHVLAGIFLFLTFLTGTLLAFNSLEFIFYCGGYFLICFYILFSLSRGEEFFISFEKNRYLRPKAPVIMAGMELPDNELEVRKEERFEDSFDPSLFAKRKVVTWVVGAVAVWFIFYFKKYYPTTNTLLSITMGLFIINSLFIGHLLIPLFILSILVLLNFSATVPVAFYALYVFFQLCSFYFISGKKFFSFQKGLKVFALLILFMSLCYGFSWILPDRRQKEKVKAKKNDISEIVSYAAQRRENLENLPLPPDIGDLALKIGENIELLKNLERKLGDVNLTEEERAKLTLEMELAFEENHQLEKLLQEKSTKGRKVSLDSDVLEKLGKMDIGPGMKGELPDEMKNTLRSYTSQAKDEMKEELPELKKVDDLLSYHSLTAEQKEELGQLLQDVQKKMEDNKKLPTVPFNPVSVKEKEVLRKLRKKEDISLWQRLKKHLPLLGLFVVFLILRHFFRKKGIRKVEVSDPGVLAELQDKWKVLRKKKFTPREEVIHYYNLFHESVQKIHYAHHEAPPSCIIRDEMEDFNPALSGPTFTITETFTRTFYGFSDVSQQSLKEFRTAIRKILKTYKLS